MEEWGFDRRKDRLERIDADRDRETKTWGVRGRQIETERRRHGE